MSQRLWFTEAQQNDILAHFIRGGDVAAGGVMHAVTSVAQTIPDADIAHEMESLAVRALEIAAALCHLIPETAPRAAARGAVFRDPSLKEAAMHDRTVVPLRPRALSGYTDTAALNDIHVLLTSTDPGDAALADIAQILCRTGRMTNDVVRNLTIMDEA